MARKKSVQVPQVEHFKLREKKKVEIVDTNLRFGDQNRNDVQIVVDVPPSKKSSTRGQKSPKFQGRHKSRHSSGRNQLPELKMRSNDQIQQKI